MNRISAFPALVLLALVTACGGDDRSGTAFAEPDTLGDLDVAPAAGMDSPPGGIGGTSPMTDLQNAGLGGEVMVADRGGETQVVVSLTGAQAGAVHDGHVHTGSCASIGGVVEALDAIEADSAGIGRMTTPVTIRPEVLTDGQHVVVYHDAGGRPLACGEIPRPAPTQDTPLN